MTLTETILVREEDERHPRGRCGYCKSKLGEPHEPGCVCIKKLIIIRETYEVLVDVPDDWDQDVIESFFNESSSCANNVFRAIGRQIDACDCACDFHETSFVRDATRDDAERFQWDKHKIGD